MPKTNFKRILIISMCSAFVLISTISSRAEQPVDTSKKTTPVSIIVPKPAKDSVVIKDSSSVSKHKVIAYYFHGTKRCVSCKKIEAYTKEAIDSAFANELKNGQLEWLVINTDSSQNEHFTEDYKLYTKSVILSDLHDGKQTRWVNLEKVWEYLDDQQKFHEYIQTELKSYLDPKK